MSERDMPQGFALLEILIAVTIMTVIAAAVYPAFRAGLDAYRRIVEQSDVNQNARNALHRLSRDLRCAYFSGANEATRLTGGRKQDGDRYTDRLRFTTYGPAYRAGAGGLECIEYFIDADPATSEQGLVRVSYGFPSRLPFAQGQYPALEIAPAVRSLKFEYFDGSSWREEWGDHLPTEVRITMTVSNDERTASEKTYVTTVPVFAGSPN